MNNELSRSSAAFRTYYGLFVALGFIFLAWQARDFPFEHFKEALLFVGFIVVADMAQISLPRGGASINASSPIDLAGIVLLGAPTMVVVEAVSSLFSELVIQRRPLIKVLFNVPLLVLTVGIAALVYQAFPDSWRSFENGRFLLPLTSSALVYYVVNTASISVVIALQGHLSVWQVWRQNYLWTLIHIFALLPIGAVISLVYRSWGPWTVFLFVLPIYLARYSFKLYVDMKEAHINTVAALTSAIDASDPFTHGHSYRVSRYALRIGRSLGLGVRDMEILEYGALLHDIGKIAIQHDILLKKDKLTDQEFLTLKQHPTIGADIVENLKFLKEAARLVRYHHEQPNGRGYPEGLKGDEIPMGARIILVADAFDAMTSDRPYRKGLDLGRVVEQFEKHRGAQFDAQITDVMLQLVAGGQFNVIVENDPTTAIYESLRERL